MNFESNTFLLKVNSYLLENIVLKIKIKYDYRGYSFTKKR